MSSNGSLSLGNTNVKVVVRVRPENSKELGSKPIVRVVDGNVLIFDPKEDNAPQFQQTRRRPVITKKHKDLQFAFDRVFDSTSTQEEVFNHTTKGIIESVLNGVNCSVFAYGATGAGKTYTMLGSQEKPGIMFLTMMELYGKIYEKQDEISCDVAVSYLEVYNEQIRDLLISSGPLPMRDNGGELVVNGLSLHKPHSADELLGMLEHGNRNRTQHPTEANATSSRSHAVFQVYVHQKPRTASMQTQVTTAKLSLIDLAGSERATVTQNRGARMREGANINRSLLALGNCINALASNKPKAYVPYRDSKLTRLLKDSLGGSCHTVMITNVSPSNLSFEDTYNTLKYADRAKQIKAKLVRNVVNVNYHVSRYKVIVDELHKEIAELKTKLTREAPVISGYDKTEAARLQGIVSAVYGQRCSLRKKLAELETAEQQLLSKIKSKDVLIRRLEFLEDASDRRGRLVSKRGQYAQQIDQVKEQHKSIHDQLQSNQDDLVKVQKEISSSVDQQKDPFALRQYMDVVMEMEKVKVENSHNWVQVKALNRYISSQEKEAQRKDRLMDQLVKFLHRAHPVISTNTALSGEYDGLIKTIMCEKGVAWADESQETSYSETTFATSQAVSPPQNERTTLSNSTFKSSQCSPDGPPRMTNSTTTAVDEQFIVPTTPTLQVATPMRLQLTTPTISSATRPLSSVNTMGRSNRRVKLLPPPPKIPTFEEVVRETNTPQHRSVHVTTPGSSYIQQHSASLHCSARLGRPPFAVPKLAFDDNFTSPPSQPAQTSCNDTYVVISPKGPQSMSSTALGGVVRQSHDYTTKNASKSLSALSNVTNKTKPTRVDIGKPVRREPSYLSMTKSASFKRNQTSTTGAKRSKENVHRSRVHVF